jgi:CHAT domain-containing protein
MSAEDAGGALSMGGLAARAGVRRVLASAWKVVDDSSAQLMQAFYTEMAKDPAHPAESLQRAKASLVDKPYGPYELANFMLSVEDPAALSFAGRIGRR